MTDFIHCNQCYAVPDPNAAKKFFLSACAHIFCQRCSERTTSDQCAVCGQKCRIMEINGQISPNVREMFMDPMQLAKKQQRQMTETLKFQKGHRSRYVQFLQQQLKKARKLHETAANEIKKRQHLERENQALKEQLMQVKQQFMRYPSGQQTPRATPNPMNRYRNAAMANDTMTVASSARTRMTHDSGASLPAGISAASFRNASSANIMVANPVSPYLNSTSSSPGGMGFGGFEQDNSSTGSPNTIIPGGSNPYDHVWRSNISAMTLGSSGSVRSQQGQGQARPQNTIPINISNIAAAFRRGL